MRLKFHKRRKARLKRTGARRARDRALPWTKFYDNLTDKEKTKYEKSALFVWKRTAPKENLATDITGWEDLGFDKDDLGWYSAPRSERAKGNRPYPDPGRVVLEDKSTEIDFINWTDPETGNIHNLFVRNGKLDIGDPPAEDVDLQVWAGWKAERHAWLAGVRGPNDSQD